MVTQAANTPALRCALCGVTPQAIFINASKPTILLIASEGVRPESSVLQFHVSVKALNPGSSTFTLHFQSSWNHTERNPFLETGGPSLGPVCDKIELFPIYTGRVRRLLQRMSSIESCVALGGLGGLYKTIPRSCCLQGRSGRSQSHLARCTCPASTTQQQQLSEEGVCEHVCNLPRVDTRRIPH